MTKNKLNVRYEVITHEDPETGDLILPIPQELLDRLGWKEDDELEWKTDSENRWILSKKDSS